MRTRSRTLAYLLLLIGAVATLVGLYLSTYTSCTNMPPNEVCIQPFRGVGAVVEPAGLALLLGGAILWVATWPRRVPLPPELQRPVQERGMIVPLGPSPGGLYLAGLEKGYEDGERSRARAGVICPQCGSMLPRGTGTCPECGYARRHETG